MISIVYVLCGVIVVQHILHCYERRDLYNRIMSKNLTEYKGNVPGYQMSAHERVLKRWRRKKGDGK